MYENITFPKEPKRPCAKPPLLNGEMEGELEKESTWFIHDPAIFHDPVSGNYYVYATHREGMRSKDLINWERMGKILDRPSEDSYAHVGTNHIWAPDIVKVGDEYRLYCSNSSFGVQQSCIYLAVSDNAEGPFIPKGAVVKTDASSPLNAIDANIVEDVKNGKQYMVYGSFWGGIYILELDKETGYAKEEGFGKCIARRPKWCDGAIEGPYIVYNPETEYYYLFCSYGSLICDYNIRVARSKNILGPYLDHNGRDMTDLNDNDNSIGYMLACGYAFHEGMQFMGPGHNSVLHDVDNQWYLVHHIREKNFKGPEPSIMHVRKMYWSQDGWPLASPEVYAGEKECALGVSDIVGKYERIRLTPDIPQGIQTSTNMELYEDGTGIFGVLTRVAWEMMDEQHIRITYANREEVYQVAPAWDYELWQPTLIITGKDNKGICLWGKKYAEMKK